MDVARTSWAGRLWKASKAVFWLLIGYVVLMQFLAPNRLESARAAPLDRFQQQRKSRVIATIYRQDAVSLFGVPVSSSISTNDSEAARRAIRLTPPVQPVDLILHTPGMPVSTNMPPTIYELMDLYPQAGSGRPSVLYVPLRRLTGDQPGRAASPAQHSTQP